MFDDTGEKNGHEIHPHDWVMMCRDCFTFQQNAATELFDFCRENRVFFTLRLSNMICLKILH